MSPLSQLLVRMAEVWPVILIITGLAIVLTVLLAYRQVRRSPAPASVTLGPPSDAVLEADVEVDVLPPAELPSPRQIRRTVAHGFRTLRERVTSRALRFRTPCFLLLGAGGAGKSTLLRQLGPDAVAPADATRAAGCRWHFYDRAVAIEVDGRLLQPGRASGASEKGWKALHRALRFHRPERPIDGIVLALPASDFFGPRSLDQDALVLRARGIFERLQAAQRALGLRVPLYLLVTKCDLLPGFQDFCDAVPEEKREESFGWANPYALDSAFSAAWIDEAFSSLSADLFRVQVELLAKDEADAPEGVFHFSRPFRALHEPLRAFITELCRESAYQEAFFFRGIYFTGDGTDDPAERLLDSVYHEVEVSVEPSEQTLIGAGALPPLPATLEVSREPYFLRDFFERKVFGETGLARSVSRSRLSRNRTILALQTAIIAVILIGGIGIWRGTVTLERERGLLLSVLTDIRSDLQLLANSPAGSALPAAGGGRPVMHQRVFPMLSSMARVNIDRLSSIFLPSSWVTSLHWDISESMRQGFTHVVLPSMHDAILLKADSLVQPPSTAVFASMGPSGEELTDYLRGIVRLGENLERYDTVSFLGAEQTELQSVSALVLYLFDEQLPPEFQGNQRYHRIALWESYGQRITARDRPTFNEDVLRRSEALVRGHYDAVITWLEGINLRFEAAGQAQRMTAADLADFRALRDDLLTVERALAGSESFWFDGSQPLGSSLIELLDSVPETAMTSPGRLRREFEEMFHRVRREKLQELELRLGRFQGTGPGAAAGPGAGGSMSLSPRLEALQTALDTLFDQPFVAGATAPGRWNQPPAGGRIRWDVAGLDRALSEHAQFEAFLAEQQEGEAAGTSRLVQGLATVQLEARMMEVVRQAMIPEPPGYTFGLRDRERDLRARVVAFEEPSRRILQILAIASDLGMAEAYNRIASLHVAEAIDMLTEVDLLLEEGRTYRPASGSLAAWDGVEPPAVAAFGARDAEELELYLEQQRARTRTLVDDYAAPILAALLADPVAPYLAAAGQGMAGLINRWAGLVENLDRYEAGAGVGSVELLEDFIRTEMTTTDLQTCLGAGRSGGVGGGDFFLATRNRLRTQLHARCDQLGAARADAAYEQIQRFFNNNLAGRYPFAPNDGGDRDEADLESLRQYFALHDLIQPYRTALGRAARVDFMEQMDEVRGFLRPILRMGDDPAYSVDVAFRTNRDSEHGADQIVDWVLNVGGTALSYRGATGTQTSSWRPGSPAALQLRWALQSNERPEGARYLSASIADRDASFSYAGRWALVRLLQNHLAGAPTPDAGYLLRFEVQTGRAPGAEAGAGSEAIVFLRLRLSDPTGESMDALPYFPTWAP